jgi:PAS domain S-box-containing protein
MQHVNPKWLRNFSYSILSVDVLLFAGYFYLKITDASQSSIDYWGITPLILVLAVIHVATTLLVYPFVKKVSEWAAFVTAMVPYGLLLSAVIETSGNVNLWYRALFVILVFMLSMVGPYLAIASAVVAWILLIFDFLSLANSIPEARVLNVVLNIIVTLSAVGGWFFFRRYYISDKKTVELTSQLEQEQFKSGIIFESITDGVMIISPQGTVQVINKSCADMLGWDRAEAKNLDYRSLFTVETEPDKPQATELSDAITQTVKSGLPVQQVSLIQTHHNKHIYVDIVASPVEVETESDGEVIKKLAGVVAVLRNVDAQKRQEQQRSDFISTASHEMRTPVASIQGFIELALNDKVTKIDDKARDYLTKAHESTKHLGELFQDLLTASKSEDGRLVNHPELIDITEFLKNIVDQTVQRAEAKGLKLTFDQVSAKPQNVHPLMFVNVDPERLTEIVSNLIENALKYTEKGIIAVGASIDDNSVIIRVSDTGVGIATEDIPHLFQKFYRTDNSVTREVGGTGLGLYITKQIAELMGGKVWVESTLGTGSTFFVQLPRVSPDQIEVLKRQMEQPEKG